MNKEMNKNFDTNDKINEEVEAVNPSLKILKSDYNPSNYEDIDDYVFMKPKVVKKKTSFSGSDNHSDVFDGTPILRSNRHNVKKHNSHKRKKKMKKWKKALLSVGCVLLGLVLLVVGTVAVLYYKGSSELLNDDYSISAPNDVQVQNNGEFVVYNGVTYQYNKNITSILLMGIDERDLDGQKIIGQAGQSDVNILLTIDTLTGKMTMINISRDTMAEITEYSTGGGYLGMETMQLCLAYSFGDGKETSCENQVNTVKRLFYNVPINSYYSLDLNGISAINDSVGGVDVVSPETIGNFKEAETYHLEGDQAESFVRLRRHDTPDANNYRMARQKVYIEAFISKVLSQTKADISTPLDLFNASGEYSCTNMNASKVCYLAATAISNGGMSFDTLSVPGESKLNGEYAEFYVDETKFYEMFLSVFYQPVG